MMFTRAQRALAATVLLGALLATVLAACGSAGRTSAADPAGPTVAPSGVASAPPRTEPVGTAATTAYTVPKPGPRTEAVVGSDVLVFDQDALSSDVVDRIEALPGVEAATRISLAQVSLENKVYNVAAVDPGAYRRFTAASSADLQEEWDRVAGGELAVSPQVHQSLPIDKQGYLTLSVNGTKQRVHVGAFAPQAGQVDMVVNTKLGEALGMVPGNAMLISTGLTSPESLRTPIERVLGGQASVQNLDVVARLGLDPKAFQTAVLVGSFSDAVGTYNYQPIGGGRISPDPAWVGSHIVTQPVPILGAVTCNKALFPQLEAALAEVVKEGLASAIHPTQYGGCYNARFIAGTTTLSNHSFGLAIDLNVPENARGTVGQMDRQVVDIFKYWGFAWGGDWHYTDPMHFELSSLVAPGG